MSWLNTNYILRAGVLSVLLLLPGLMSATCKRDTIINNYKDDSLRFIIKDDSIITFRNGESSFTIIKADSVLPATPKHTKHTRYDNRVHRFRRNWERIIPTHSKIQYAGNMGLLSFGTGWDYGKRNQWETDVLLGFIPKYSSKKAKVTMTLKQNYVKQYAGIQFCTAAHTHHHQDDVIFDDGIHYVTSDCMDYRTYLVFTITPEKYEYELVKY